MVGIFILIKIICHKWESNPRRRRRQIENQRLRPLGHPDYERMNLVWEYINEKYANYLCNYIFQGKPRHDIKFLLSNHKVEEVHREGLERNNFAILISTFLIVICSILCKYIHSQVGRVV